MDDKFSVSNIVIYAFAYSLILALFCLSFVNYSVPTAGLIRPSFFLCVIYFWAIYRPSLLPSILTFALGVLHDLYMGYPLALHAVIFLGAFLLIKSQRLFFLGQSYTAIWLGFILTGIAFYATQYLFFSLYLQNLPSMIPLLGSFVLTVVVFPPLSFLFIKINNVLPVSSNLNAAVD